MAGTYGGTGTCAICPSSAQSSRPVTITISALIDYVGKF